MPGPNPEFVEWDEDELQMRTGELAGEITAIWPALKEDVGQTLACEDIDGWERYARLLDMGAFVKSKVEGAVEYIEPWQGSAPQKPLIYDQSNERRNNIRKSVSMGFGLAISTVMLQIYGERLLEEKELFAGDLKQTLAEFIVSITGVCLIRAGK